jgi:hypothetical protein
MIRILVGTLVLLRTGLLLAGTAAIPSHDPELLSLRVAPVDIRLMGGDASQRLVVLGVYSDGFERDVTALSRIQVQNPSVATLVKGTSLTPRADGNTVVTADLGGHSAQAAVLVEESRRTRPFSFSRDIGGILTKRGCNASECHGGVKGRGGFKLSLDVLHPREDYRWIVEGGNYQVLSVEAAKPIKPRVSTETPKDSLLLLKPTASVPHGGGTRFGLDSPDYQTIQDWVRSGAPYEEVGEARIERLEILPGSMTLEPKGTRQLLVTAHLAGGGSQDVTSQVRYSAANSDVVRVGVQGRVEALSPGATTILVRAPGHVANLRVGVVGDLVTDYPRIPENNLIDRHVLAQLKKLHVVPSNLSSDEEFLRRVCLDLTGTLPPPARVQEFLEGRDPQKREKLIDTLLETPEYIDYWTYRFADLYRVSYGSTGTPAHAYAYWAWIRDSITENKPYDQMALERLSAQGHDGPSRHFLPNGEAGRGEEMMPEEMRVYLGQRLDCAQCHHHPFEKWSQEQFWGLAAFFGRISRTEWVSEGAIVIFDDPSGRVPDYGETEDTVKVLHPRTGEEVTPMFPDGSPLSAERSFDPRLAFAEWMVSHPDFSRTIVNRMWAYMMGRGIVDPVDDFRSSNPPTHPQLLDALAQDFVDHGYDLKHLLRRIARSRTYQLSARSNPTNKNDLVNYSHRRPRGLDGEILLDALSSVTGVPEEFKNSWMGAAPAGTRAIHLQVPDLHLSRFLTVHDRPTRKSLPERKNEASLRQALHLLVGETYQEKISSPGSHLDQLLKGQESDHEILEELFLRSLSRYPTPSEGAELQRVVTAKSSRREAFEDVLWALVTSREFARN